jgi:hypothetical protein
MSKGIVDYIVVGSGCAGAMAAQTLVESGSHVVMLDVGADTKYSPLIPDKDYLDIRKTESDQHRYFLGDDAEGLAWGKVGKGEQITPPRKHILHMVEEYAPVQSKTFFPVESLGYGGLGIGWGLGCWEFSAAEQAAAKLDVGSMSDAYDTVSRRIGISAQKDSARDYTIGNLRHYQPASVMDRNHDLLYRRYLAKEKSLNKKGFVMGRAPLALLTKDLGERKRYAYRDMDFYSDKDQSAWRPWITVNSLRKQANFEYVGHSLVTKFIEKKDHVEVHVLSTDTNEAVIHRCKRLVLGSSAMGTARIALRSIQNNNKKLPLLCNPYSYVPAIQTAMVGKAAEPHKLGFAQLSLFLDETGRNIDTSMASIYGYQSLMLFRIIKQAPLNFVDARILMRYLMSGIVIMGIHQSDKPTEHKFVQLTKDARSNTGDRLKASYSLTSAEAAEKERRERKYVHALSKLGVHAVKRIDPGFGASIHYAGTLPFSSEEKPFTLSRSGRLHGTRNVYVADSAGFNYLPAKGLTFSLLANAHVAARNALNHA